MRAKFVLFVSLLLVTTPAWAETIYVSPEGDAFADGSRDNPTTLQTALDRAAANGMDDAINLMKGTYLATGDGFTYGTTGNDGKAVRLRGGYDSESLGDRSDDPADTVLDGGGVRRVLDVRADIDGVGSSFELDTLTVQNGHIENHDTPDDVGAGVRAWRENGGIVRLEILDCAFRNNEAAGTGRGGALGANCWVSLSRAEFTSNRARVGGAIYLVRSAGENGSSTSYLSGAVFEGNRLSAGPDAQGSAVYCDVSPHLDSCEFDVDPAGTGSEPGSPVFFTGGVAPEVRNCRFTGSTVDGSGSAIVFENSGGEVTNCLFVNNTAGESGALTIRFDAQAAQVPLTVTNSTFAGNRSLGGFGGAIDTRNHATVVVNSIFWDNGTRPIHRSEAGQTPSLRYSLVQGGLADTGFTDDGGNILDPTVSPFAGMYDFRPATDSVCVDAGDNSADHVLDYDMDGLGRPYDGNGSGTATVDLGAFELSPDLLTAPSLVARFGEVEIGKDVTLSVELRNVGSLDLLIENVAISGGDAGDFALKAPFVPNRSLAPRESLTVEIVFTPSALHDRYANLDIVSDDPDFNSAPILNGTGVPFVLLSPTDGTIGTEMELFGGPFGTKKGKVWLQYEDAGGRTKKRSMKILEWTDDRIRALVRKGVSRREYRVMVRTRVKGSDPKDMGQFGVWEPVVTHPSENSGAPGEVLYLQGYVFGDGTAKPRLYLEYRNSKGKQRRKRVKLLRKTIFTDSATGQSTVSFRVPNLDAVSGRLIFVNRIGEDSTGSEAFTILKP